MNNVLDIVKAKAKAWKPRFTWTDDVLECADIINAPHEDYPQRVGVTAEAIRLAADAFRSEGKLVEKDVLNIHSKIMRDSNIRVGEWRRTFVSITNRRGEVLHRPPDPSYVPMLIMSIMPVTAETDLAEWYSLFETVHPFEDGNGRVGGTVIAAVSMVKEGRYMTPGQ